jgi:ferritin
MDKKLQKVFNDQIKHELYSAHIYLAMAAYFETKNLPGFAHWMKIQYKEEVAHAMKMFEFLNDRGQRVLLQAIPQPTWEFSSSLEVFEETLKHEQKVTSLINALYELAKEVNDHASVVFLQWFVTEQVEEEKNASVIIQTLKIIKSEGAPLIMLDRELAKRE